MSGTEREGADSPRFGEWGVQEGARTLQLWLAGLCKMIRAVQLPGLAQKADGGVQAGREGELHQGRGRRSRDTVVCNIPSQVTPGGELLTVKGGRTSTPRPVRQAAATPR